MRPSRITGGPKPDEGMVGREQGGPRVREEGAEKPGRGGGRGSGPRRARAEATPEAGGEAWAPPSLGASRRNQPCRRLDFGLLASYMAGE